MSVSNAEQIFKVYSCSNSLKYNKWIQCFSVNNTFRGETSSQIFGLMRFNVALRESELMTFIFVHTLYFSITNRSWRSNITLFALNLWRKV